MLNQTNTANMSAGLNVVTKILPVLGIERIGSTGQELTSKAQQFVLGQLYEAKVLEKISGSEYLVKIDQTLLKMGLGNAAQLGQTLSLRYLQDQPVPTFLLAQTLSKNTDSPVLMSQAGHLIDHFLKEAKAEGATSRYQATAVVTQQPNNPQVLAQDLKHAVSQTGLFYESHLNDFAQGTRSLSAMMQEPQNALQSTHSAQLATLVSQQLNVLENQRFSWNGDVWQGQKMNLDVYHTEHQTHNDRKANEQSPSEDRPIFSEMTLHLPNLGTVSAKLSLIDGRLKINLQAAQANTLDTLNRQRLSLAEAIEKNGQSLDALTVAAFSSQSLSERQR